MDRKTEIRKIKKYQSILSERRVAQSVNLTDITVCPCGYKTSNTPPALSEFVPFAEGDRWGSGIDTHAWFHVTVDDVKAGQFLRVLTDRKGWDANNPQFIAYINGEMRQGLDTNHTEVRLDEGKNDIYLYAYVGMASENALLFLSLLTPDQDVTDLFYDIQYPLDMLDYLNPEYGEYAEIVKYLYEAVSMLELDNEEDFARTVKEAHDFMQREFYGSYCCEQKATTVCIGHTHIDCAWKWTLLQTREKVQRSFATVLELMKRYPEYKFMSSQPLLYQNLKEEAPALYEQVKERIQEGRWEAEGAMWVEADCNLSSGESLVRQVLHGKNFFQKEFGVNSHILWLPDVFGYSAALPQILRKSGVDWFVTSKISWNDMNQIPYDTFLWKGVDGTGINTFFLTAQNDDGQSVETHGQTTYNGIGRSPMISGTYRRYNQKELSNEVIDTFGFGDGGGGPTVELLETIRRGSYGVPGSPNAKIDFAGNFLSRLEKKIANNPQLPTWQGELYLEFHRGTYTTQARNKLHNRRGEFLYQRAEWMASLDKKFFGTAYPKDAFDKGWKILLTNQFHDIIPGSSIREVYEQCEIDYAEAFDLANNVLFGAERNFSKSLDEKGGYVVFNPNSFASRGLIEIDGKSVLTPVIPSKGYALTKDFETKNHVAVDGKTVTTDRYRVTFDDNWQMVSIFDILADREVLRDGAVGNELRLYDDYPNKYDAWEWQRYNLGKYKTITDVKSVEVVDDGVRRGIRIERAFGKSSLVQTIWFYDSIGKIDFETKVDWHENHRMLKTAFPTDIQADHATFEIQFGRIERPTHFNTSWEWAKFETCAHKYADLSDGGFGVSIINDCKYGHDIHDGVIQLSLLRAPTDPDPIADRGEQVFTYSICPHAGSLQQADTVELAYLLNVPMVAVKATGKENKIPTSYSTLSINRDNIICETVKEAENGDGTVMRFYECKNCSGKAKITVGLDAKKAYLCDLLENELEELPISNGEIEVKFGNFEIQTVKVK